MDDSSLCFVLLTLCFYFSLFICMWLLFLDGTNLTEDVVSWENILFSTWFALPLHSKLKR
jgi:hypothetical protein